MSGGAARRLRGLLAAALAFVLLVAVGLYLAVSYKMLTYPHEVIVTEGAIGLAVRSWLDGTPAYDPSRWTEAPFVIVHYTPLYYLVTAAWTWLSGAGLFAGGRLVSILSTGGTAILARWLVRRETGRALPALAAGALWLSFYQVVFWGTTQRVDALGTLLEAGGLLAYIAARRRGRTGYGALPFFAGAWLTKQVMVVGLGAAVLDLFLADRRRGLRFAAAGGGTLVLLFALLTLWSGGGFWTAAVMGTVSADADPPWVIFSNAELFFGSPWNVVLFLVASLGAALGMRQAASTGLYAPYRFLGLYLWLGLAVAIATDANLPRFFPPMLAMAVLTALLLDRLGAGAGTSAPAAAVPASSLQTALLLVLAFTGAAHTLYEMRSLVRERILTLRPGNERLLFAEAVRRHTPEGAEVLAQDVGMALSAERTPVVADPYVFSILAGNDAWHPDALIAGIREQRYAAVILNRPAESMNDWEWTTLWISPAKEEILRHYRLAEVVAIEQGWRFLEPQRYIYVPADAAVPVTGGAGPAAPASYREPQAPPAG